MRSGDMCEVKKATETGREIIDTKEGECWFECSFYGGRKFMGVDAIK